MMVTVVDYWTSFQIHIDCAPFGQLQSGDLWHTEVKRPWQWEANVGHQRGWKSSSKYFFMIFLLYNSNEMYFKKGNNMKIEKKKLFALHFTVWINILKDIKMFVCTLTTQFQSRARVYCTMTFILLQWKIYSFVFILYSSRGSSFSYFLLLSLLSSRVATEEAFRCQIYLFASLLSLFFLLYFI